MACLMIGLIIWFAADLRFYVFAAQVQGSSLASADEIFRAAGLNGMSIFHINPGKVASDIRARIPGVEQVSVQLALPDAVELLVREGDARFVWRSLDVSYLVDGDGRVLGSGGSVANSWVTINDLDGHPVLLGGSVHKDACNAASQLQSLLPEVRSFDYSEAKGISLLDMRGWRVYFGDAQDIAHKVAVWQGIVQKLDAEGQQASVIDVRFPDAAYYR
jgi:cell division septal protein FtsQ